MLYFFEILVFKRPKFWILGISWGHRPHAEGETVSGTDMYTVVQNFTPIGVTVAEISVTMGREYAYAKMEYVGVRTCLSKKNRIRV